MLLPWFGGLNQARRLKMKMVKNFELKLLGSLLRIELCSSSGLGSLLLHLEAKRGGKKIKN